MRDLAGFIAAGSRGFYRPTGSASVWQLSDMITAALERARDLALTDVLLDVSVVTGFESPGPAYRRWAARRWAAVLGPGVRVAMVARREHICPDKVGLIAAAEEGMHAHICERRDQALAWLDEQHRLVLR